MTNKTEKKIPTIEQERLKLLRQYATNKGLISRNKPRYEAITPKKIAENADNVEKKAAYKKLYKDAEKKLVPVVKRLKEIESILVQVKQLKSEGKDTSHLGVKPKKSRGRPKKIKEEGEVEFKTTITKGAPLKREDFTEEEFKQVMRFNGAIAKLTKQNKQIDIVVEKANEEGRQVHGIDEEEYEQVKKDIIKLTKERDALNNIVRKRVDKQDIVTKTQIGGPKKQRGRPIKEKVEVEKRPRGRPVKPKIEVEKRARGRPPKVKPVKNVEDVKVDVKQIAKEVVSNKLKSIVDEIIKEHTPVKKTAKKTKLPMKLTKFNKKNGEAEIINTRKQIDNDIVDLPVQEKIIKKANITLPKDKLIQQLPKAEVKQHDINLFKSLPIIRYSFLLYLSINISTGIWCFLIYSFNSSFFIF